jgi:hypothetical protein
VVGTLVVRGMGWDRSMCSPFWVNRALVKSMLSRGFMDSLHSGRLYHLPVLCSYCSNNGNHRIRLMSPECVRPAVRLVDSKLHFRTSRLM